jgi:serine/threonine-protein kinase RsbW
METEVTLRLVGPVDQLRLAWQVGEGLLDQVAFAEEPEATRYNVLVALQEMVTNVLRHAYGGDENRPIELRYRIDAEAFEVTLEDEGQAFDPLAHDTTEVEGDHEMPVDAGGYGIFITRQVMDELSYERVDGKNQLRLRKLVRASSKVR